MHTSFYYFSLFSLSSSAYDVVLRQKVAVKKLSRPFQSLIHSRRSYRELRLLKHMKHENVSAPRENTQRQSDAAPCMFPLCYWSALLVSVSAGNRAAGRLHTCCSVRGLQRTVIFHPFMLSTYALFTKNSKILLLEWRVVLVEVILGDDWLVEMSDRCHGSITMFSSELKLPRTPHWPILSLLFDSQLPGD